MADASERRFYEDDVGFLRLRTPELAQERTDFVPFPALDELVLLLPRLRAMLEWWEERQKSFAAEPASEPAPAAEPISDIARGNIEAQNESLRRRREEINRERAAQQTAGQDAEPTEQEQLQIIEEAQANATGFMKLCAKANHRAEQAERELAEAKRHASDADTWWHCCREELHECKRELAAAQADLEALRDAVAKLPNPSRDVGSIYALSADLMKCHAAAKPGSGKEGTHD